MQSDQALSSIMKLTQHQWRSKGGGGGGGQGGTYVPGRRGLGGAKIDNLQLSRYANGPAGRGHILSLVNKRSVVWGPDSTAISRVPRLLDLQRKLLNLFLITDIEDTVSNRHLHNLLE